MSFTLGSPAFALGGKIPVKYSCDGADLSPPLHWVEAPAATLGFALVCADPDAPAGTWYHWAIFDIPVTVRSLSEHYRPDAHDGIREATNDFDRPGYGGPCPPRGHGQHHYHFTLYALNVARLPVTASPRCRDVERAAQQHALARAELVGVYGR